MENFEARNTDFCIMLADNSKKLRGLLRKLNANSMKYDKEIKNAGTGNKL